MNKLPDVMVDVKWGAIVKVFLVAILFYVLYLIRSVLVWMLLALIVSILLNPLIRSLEKKKVPRVAAAVIVYFSLVILVGLAVWALIPPLASEAAYFSSANFSGYFDKLPQALDWLGLNSIQDIASLNANLEGSLVKFSSNIIGIVSGVFGTLFGGITVFALALFMSIEEKDIVSAIRMISPKKFEEEVLKRWQKSQEHVGGWFGSRVICSIAVILMTFLMCAFLNIKFSLILSLIAGLLNFVPVFGPVATAVLIGLVAAMDSWPKVILVVILSVIIQQIESNVLTPILTKKMIGLPNVLVLSSILVGGILGGVIGAILAIPFAGIIFDLLRDYFNNRKKEQEEA